MAVAPERAFLNAITTLQSEFQRHAVERATWLSERSALQSRVAVLEADAQTSAGLRDMLLRRVRMLEFALLQERQGKAGEPAAPPTDAMPLTASVPAVTVAPDALGAMLGSQRASSVIIADCLKRLGYTDTGVEPAPAPAVPVPVPVAVAAPVPAAAPVAASVESDDVIIHAAPHWHALHQLRAHTDAVRVCAWLCLDVSGDVHAYTPLLATGGDDACVRVWAQAHSTYTPTRSGDAVHALRLRMDAALDVNEDVEPVATLRGHASVITALCEIGGHDHSHARAHALIRARSVSSSAAEAVVAASSPCHLILSAAADGNVCIHAKPRTHAPMRSPYDTTAASSLPIHSFRASEGAVTAVCAWDGGDSNAHAFATADVHGHVVMWQLTSAGHVRMFDVSLASLEGPITQMESVKRGHITALLRGRTLAHVDTSTRAYTTVAIPGGAIHVCTRFAAFVEDAGAVIAFVAVGENIVVLRDAALVRSFHAHNGMCTGVAVCTVDGERACVTVGADADVRVWSNALVAAQEPTCVWRLRAHGSRFGETCTHVACNPFVSGGLCATAGADGVARLFACSTDSNGTADATLRPPAAAAVAAASSPSAAEAVPAEGATVSPAALALARGGARGGGRTRTFASRLHMSATPPQQLQAARSGDAPAGGDA